MSIFTRRKKYIRENRSNRGAFSQEKKNIPYFTFLICTAWGIIIRKNGSHTYKFFTCEIEKILNCSIFFILPIDSVKENVIK